MKTQDDETRARDAATRARANGKQEVERRTVWRLSIGPLEVRCLKDEKSTAESPLFVVQGRTDGGWNRDLGRGPDPLKMLRLVGGSTAAKVGLEEALRRAK